MRWRVAVCVQGACVRPCVCAMCDVCACAMCARVQCAWARAMCVCVCVCVCECDMLQRGFCARRCPDIGKKSLLPQRPFFPKVLRTFRKKACCRSVSGWRSRNFEFANPKRCRSKVFFRKSSGHWEKKLAAAATFFYGNLAN